ncbi:MAG TPA: hypothetical protein VIR77_04000, partial [Pontiella sp.]
MRCSGIIIVFAAIIGITSAGWAEEANDAAVRISLGSAPGWDELDLGGGLSGGIDDKMGGQLEVLYQKRFWKDELSSVAGVFGGGLFFTSATGEVTDGIDTVEIDTRAFGVILQGGVANKVSDRVVIEVMPYVGFGLANTEIAVFGTVHDDGEGAYTMIGIKGGVFVQLSDSMELGAEIGFQRSSADYEVGGG